MVETSAAAAARVANEQSPPSVNQPQMRKDVTLPSVKPYDPTTFEERGVAVPFTTPMLAGTRARPVNQQRVELVIPNPSGGRGVYVMPWAAIADWCQPTLHDTVFNEKVAGLRNITPATIRQIALEVAADGLAGEEAMEAALAACNAAKSDRMVTNYRLLMTLVEQVGARFPSSSSAIVENKADPIKQARSTIDWISPHLGQPATWTAGALEALSDVMANIGVGAADAAGRLPRLLTMLRQTCTDMSEWSGLQTQQDQLEYVQMTCDVAELTLSIAHTTLTKAWALTDDMLGLLRAWAADPNSVSRLVVRPEWLLDGWERICLLWRSAQDDAERRVALIEIAGLLPILPKEANEWSDLRSASKREGHFRRLVPLNEDWRTGALIFQAIARNEHLRAMTFSAL